jgi:hypothetical protein
MLASAPTLASGILKKIEVKFNGIKVVADDRPVNADNILYNGTTYLPMREVANIVGKDISWDAASNTAYLRDKGQSDKPEVPSDKSPVTAAGLTYLGKKDVSSKYADGKLIEDINHYALNMGEGKPINIYVTDDYDRRYGKGFAYEELKEMVTAIEKKKGFKPYALPDSSLDIYFYTNESGTPLPSDRQGATGAWSMNGGKGVPNEMIMNGSNIRRDLRQILVHELYHYFDYQSHIIINRDTYNKYWGEDYFFWLMEGAAEYCSYFYYDYPANTKNQLKPYDVKDKNSIIQYAIQQAGGKKNVMYDIPLETFADIKKASNTNYGVAVSFYWYLTNEFGPDKVNAYTKEIAERYTPQSVIAAKDREETAKKIFGKTEPQIMKEWLSEFNYFNGKLESFVEQTVATADYVLFENDPLLSEDSKDLFEKHNRPGGLNFSIGLKEQAGQDENFRKYGPQNFKLTAKGNKTVMFRSAGGSAKVGLTDGRNYSVYQFLIEDGELVNLVKGVEYTIEPLDNTGKYNWIIPTGLKFVYEG